MIAVPDRSLPVVPDTGTAEADRLAAGPQAPSAAGQIAVQAVAAAGLAALLVDVERVAVMLMADAIGHTHAPVELTVNTHDEVIHVELRDQGPSARDALPPAG